MRFRSIITNHKQFESDVEDIIRYAQESIADLPYKTRIPPEGKQILLEALILRICALWEKFIEEEITAAIRLNNKKLLQVMGLKPRTRLNAELVRAVVFSDRFRNFQDIDTLVYFSKKVIEEKYNPFKRITSAQKKKIHFAYKIRNYLSHYSGFSKRALFSAYKQFYGYSKFLEPGRFLLRNKGRDFEDLAMNFKLTSVNMRKLFKQR